MLYFKTKWKRIREKSAHQFINIVDEYNIYGHTQLSQEKKAIDNNCILTDVF